MRGGPAAIGAGAVVVLLASLVVAISSPRSEPAVTPAARHGPSASPTSAAPSTPSPGPASAPVTTAPTTTVPTTAPATPGPATRSSDPARRAEPEPASSTSAPSPTSPPPSTPPASSPTATAAATSFAPIPAGTYVYDTTGTTRLGSSEPRPLPPETTLQVQPAGPDGRQRQVRDMRDDDGFGQRTTSDYRYAGEQVLLSRVEITTRVRFLGGVTDTRTFTATPPGVVAATGDRPGDTRRFTMSGDGTTLDVRITILRSETVQVGGQAVDALVVEQVIDLSGEVEGRATTTSWVRPGDLLLLRAQSRSDVTARGVRSRSQQTSVLQTLAPR